MVQQDHAPADRKDRQQVAIVKMNTGVEEVNFDLYPDENFQKWWLRIYLSERARLTGMEVWGNISGG